MTRPRSGPRARTNEAGWDIAPNAATSESSESRSASTAGPLPVAAGWQLALGPSLGQPGPVRFESASRAEHFPEGRLPLRGAGGRLGAEIRVLGLPRPRPGPLALAAQLCQRVRQKCPQVPSRSLSLRVARVGRTHSVIDVHHVARVRVSTAWPILSAWLGAMNSSTCEMPILNPRLCTLGGICATLSAHGLPFHTAQRFPFHNCARLPYTQKTNPSGSRRLETRLDRDRRQSCARALQCAPPRPHPTGEGRASSGHPMSATSLGLTSEVTPQSRRA